MTLVREWGSWFPTFLRQRWRVPGWGSSTGFWADPWDPSLKAPL